MTIARRARCMEPRIAALALLQVRNRICWSPGRVRHALLIALPAELCPCLATIPLMNALLAQGHALVELARAQLTTVQPAVARRRILSCSWILPGRPAVAKLSVNRVIRIILAMWIRKRV